MWLDNMNSKTRTYVVNVNRVIIFLLIVISVIFDNNFCAILAAAYWLWLPNITKFEFSLLALKFKNIQRKLD